MSKYKWFSEDEFARCNPPCKLSDMDEAFMNKLDTARTISGVSYPISSAYRSKEYQLSKGRSIGYHPKRCAVDIKCTDSRIRFRIIYGLISAGLTGIGVSSTFIHVDNRNAKPLVFLYK